MSGSGFNGKKYACLFRLKENEYQDHLYLDDGNTLFVENPQGGSYMAFFFHESGRFFMYAVPMNGQKRGLYKGVTCMGKELEPPRKRSVFLLKEGDEVVISGKQVLVHEVY